ncbi:UNVERIFIED_CONTAM: hypothetical protein Slati_2526300 [Sesamum latifolium]|uniref:Uncharacterized protein n=1 Tax=Sesamum latifolium TaxID=2727402 RepID=A0AAW2WGA3_9LAMI
MIDGLSIQKHGVKMLPIVDKLKDLSADLKKETHVDMILQSLPPSFDPFIMNYNMNGLEKVIDELINILIQYEAMTEKSASSVLFEEASTSRAKGKGARCWKRKKDETELAAANVLNTPITPLGEGNGKEYKAKTDDPKAKR